MSVLSVSTSTTHSFSKSPCSSIYLLTGRGIQGDAHCSPTPTTSPKQIHLIDASLFATLSGFDLSPGELGENITTQDLDLFALLEGTRLVFGDGTAVVRITGLREPKKRLSEWPVGLLAKAEGRIGVYATVEKDGEVKTGMGVRIESPEGGGKGLVGV